MDSNAKNPQTYPRIVRKVGEIKLVPYGISVKSSDGLRTERIISTEPSSEEVGEALHNRELEARGYQSHISELIKEWQLASNGGQNPEAWARLERAFHARRIAYFVVFGWSDPISVGQDGVIIDGSHRIRAAMFKAMIEVEIEINK